MAKFVLFVLIVFAVWWLWRSRRGSDAPPQESPEQKMVCCAHCGVYLPESESLGEGGTRYCSVAHQLADQKRDD